MLIFCSLFRKITWLFLESSITVIIFHYFCSLAKIIQTLSVNSIHLHSSIAQCILMYIRNRSHFSKNRAEKRFFFRKFFKTPFSHFLKFADCQMQKDPLHLAVLCSREITALRSRIIRYRHIAPQAQLPLPVSQTRSWILQVWRVSPDSR